MKLEAAMDELQHKHHQRYMHALARTIASKQEELQRAMRAGPERACFRTGVYFYEGKLDVPPGASMGDTLADLQWLADKTGQTLTVKFNDASITQSPT